MQKLSASTIRNGKGGIRTRILRNMAFIELSMSTLLFVLIVTISLQKDEARNGSARKEEKEQRREGEWIN